MRLSSVTSFRAVFFGFVLVACGSESSGGGESSGTDVQGEIRGRPFRPTAYEVWSTTAGYGPWIFIAHDRSAACERARPKDSELALEIHNLSGNPETIEKAMGQSHATPPGAAAGSAAIAGTLVVESFAREKGATIRGSLDVKGPDGKVSGNFRATVCGSID